VADTVDARGELRASASAVPMPTATASHAAPAVGDERLPRWRSLESPVLVATLPSSSWPTGNPRAPGASVLAGLVRWRARGELAAGEIDLHALVAQDARAGPDAFSVGRRWRPRRARCRPRDRIGAGGLLALVAAARAT
jgi:hypothetical protein